MRFLFVLSWIRGCEGVLVWGLTFELTGTLRWADFGLGSWAQNWTAAKCPVERVVRPRRASSLSDATIGFDAIWQRVAGYLHLR